MKKLSDKFMNSVNPEFACINELAVLPENGDCGFIEYFDYKADRIIEMKKIFSSFSSQNKLMLEYPGADCKESDVFERFFESPSVIADNHNFEGLFAIDISNYINKLEHERFQALISYIKANPQAVYTLFFYSENEKEIQRIYRYLLQHMDIIRIDFPKPTTDQLIEYTYEGISRFGCVVEDAVRDVLYDLYSKNDFAYDVVDYLVRFLRLTGFDGSAEQLKNKIENLDIAHATSGNYTGMGY